MNNTDENHPKIFNARHQQEDRSSLYASRSQVVAMDTNTSQPEHSTQGPLVSTRIIDIILVQTGVTPQIAQS